jgi:hypothetical protein
MAQSRNLLSNPGIDQMGVDRARFNAGNGTLAWRTLFAHPDYRRRVKGFIPLVY